MSEHDSTTSLSLNIQYHTIQGTFVQTIDARELHERLEVGTHFRHWIAKRIDEYGFQPDIDFLFWPRMSQNPGRPEHIYMLTLDMAKELCMVERSEKGQQARRYFIKCEKALTNVQGLVSTMIEPVTLLIQQCMTLVERMDHRLQALEETRQVVTGSDHLTMKGQLPPPAPRIKEHAEVSWHMARLWTLLRHTDEWLSNRELAHRSGIKERTARAHTRYFRQLGLIEVHEYFPNHLHRMAEDAEARNPAVYHRLNMIATLIEERRRP
jgi:phage anti-repressor protein